MSGNVVPCERNECTRGHFFAVRENTGTIFLMYVSNFWREAGSGLGGDKKGVALLTAPSCEGLKQLVGH